MKLKPIVPMMSLIFAATLTGCNLDGASNSSSGGSSSGGGDNGTSVPSEPTSPLAGGYWNIGASTKVATYADSIALPSVYIFQDNTQYYYEDTNADGAYDFDTEVLETEYTEDIEAGELSFTYYGDGNGGTVTDGTYSATSTSLTVSTATYGELTGSNESSNEAIAAAVEAANEEGGITVGVTDNFDSYTAGTPVMEANPVWVSYNVSPEVDDEDGAFTSRAIISDEQSNSGANSLLIEDNDDFNKPFATRAFSAPTTKGSVSFDVYIPETNEKTTYINVGAGKNNSDRYFELRLSGSGKVEAEAGDKDIEIGAITNNAWNSLSLTWDGDTITVTINGEDVAMTQAETGLTAGNTPSQLNLYTGDTSGNANKAYFDNIDSDLF